MSRSSGRPQPEFFVDRSLGAVVVPAGLRAAGFVIQTMRERYGEARAQTIEDEEWLDDVGPTGLAVLMKDKRIRTRPAERAAVERHGLRCFCLARGDLQGPAMAQLFAQSQRAIYSRAREAGPFIYSVSAAGLVRLLPEA